MYVDVNKKKKKIYIETRHIEIMRIDDKRKAKENDISHRWKPKRNK